eukprot:9159099-Pyramimonas_sp.AAC.1
MQDDPGALGGDAGHREVEEGGAGQRRRWRYMEVHGEGRGGQADNEEEEEDEALTFDPSQLLLLLLRGGGGGGGGARERVLLLLLLILLLLLLLLLPLCSGQDGEDAQPPCDTDDDEQLTEENLRAVLAKVPWER